MKPEFNTNGFMFHKEVGYYNFGEIELNKVRF